MDSFEVQVKRIDFISLDFVPESDSDKAPFKLAVHHFLLEV